MRDISMASTTAQHPTAPRDEAKPVARRADVIAIWVGIAFSFVFTLVIWVAADRLAAFPKLPDQGPAWYYWKLAEPTALSRVSSWLLYVMHQFAIWGLIWYAQKYVKKYKPGLHTVNWVALGLNALFVALHFLQTHIFYDGLAQDTSIFSSQGAVVIMLVWILLMERTTVGD
jgi:hypothetical protein